MKIGYPCINYTLGCRGNKTFRLRSYSDDRLIRTIQSNLTCLQNILEYNVQHHLYFFRISSDLIPFASHPVCKYEWQSHFRDQFREIGHFIRKHRIRISMHPDQFTLINAEKESIYLRSQAELMYHVNVLDAMNLDASAKIQIHIGGIYQNREVSIGRFIRRYHQLDERLKRRLVIENDESCFPLTDCLKIQESVAVPIVFDVFHHGLYHAGESCDDALKAVSATWSDSHGLMMLDYSSQEPGLRKGSHAKSLDPQDFMQFIQNSRLFDFDLMLEIKDKEFSAIRALQLLKGDSRLFQENTLSIQTTIPILS